MVKADDVPDVSATAMSPLGAERQFAFGVVAVGGFSGALAISPVAPEQIAAPELPNPEMLELRKDCHPVPYESCELLSAGRGKLRPGPRVRGDEPFG
jgi:hypothetical protein